MKNKNTLLPWVLAAIAFCFLLLAFMAWHQYLQQCETTTDLQRDKMRLHIETLNYLTEMEAAQQAATELTLELDSTQHVNRQMQEQHARHLARLRSKPAIPVTTTNVVLAECDSAIDAGKGLVAENQKQQQIIDELNTSLSACRKAHAKRDTTDKIDSLIQNGLLETNDMLRKQVQKEQNKKRFWQGTTLVLALNEARRWIIQPR